MRYPTSQTRISAKVPWLALLAVLAAGVAIAPHRLAAQSSAPAVGSQPAPEAAKPAAEGDDIYRHTALVQASAKALHLQIETMARVYELINFAIIVLAIGIPLVRFMPKVIRKRSQTLLHNIESARKATGDANGRLSAIEVKLSRLDEEIAAIRDQVEKEMLEDQARIKAVIGEEGARIVASAEQEIAVAAAQARRGLRHFAADLAIEQAAKQLVLTPEADRELIAEFSAELSSNGTANGGQN